MGCHELAEGMQAESSTPSKVHACGPRVTSTSTAALPETCPPGTCVTRHGHSEGSCVVVMVASRTVRKSRLCRDMVPWNRHLPPTPVVSTTEMPHCSKASRESRAQPNLVPTTEPTAGHRHLYSTVLRTHQKFRGEWEKREEIPNNN